MDYKSVNFQEKFSLFDEQWTPKVIAQMNDYQFKAVKIQGNFVWHKHVHPNETFMALEGNLRIDFRDDHVDLTAGEMFVVHKSVEHKSFAKEEVKMHLIEPKGVLNTGNEELSGLTAENDVWI